MVLSLHTLSMLHSVKVLSKTHQGWKVARSPKSMHTCPADELYFSGLNHEFCVKTSVHLM